MKPIGTVISSAEGRASVHLVRQSACESCNACMLGTSDSSTITVDALDPIGVTAGQRVELYIPAQQGLRAAFIAYSIPLVALFLGYALLSLFNLPGGELIPAIGSVILSFAAFSLLRIKEKDRASDPLYLPSITAIIS